MPRFGFKFSEESKKRMSIAQKGHIPWNVGIPHSDATKKKLSLARLGKTPWNKGKKSSDEQRKFLSESRRGKNNPNWKNGATPFNERVRKSLEMQLWKQACRARDNFTCQKYGTIGVRLEVHHIYNFADFPEFRTSIGNGITLSKKAHLAFHKRYGRINNNKEQLEEFLGYKLSL
jgi:hypothetical protein